jgi:hypothetical protein
MPNDSLEQSLRVLEQDLGLSSGFLVRLWAEDNDWFFVIKAHALLETALSDLLAAHLLDRRLHEVVQHLPVGGRGGKVAFLKAMGLLTKDEESFINEFSKLRNSLVHNVHTTSFDFQTFLATDPRRARQLAKSAAAFGDTPEVRQRYEHDFPRKPKHLLWLATLFVVAKSRKTLLRTEEERRELEERVRRLYEL